MPKLTKRDTFAKAADSVAACFRRMGVQLTIGGEPSYVPEDFSGPEWNITAIGPTKLRYAYALADALIEKFLPGALAILSPGKSYPGETNPRWAIHLLSNRDGTPVIGWTREPSETNRKETARLAALRRALATRFSLRTGWLRARDGLQSNAETWVLPLDHDGTKWITDRWLTGENKELMLTNAEGPAGLRLPLGTLPPEAIRRALVLENKEDGLHIFLPPLIQQPFLEMVQHLSGSLVEAGVKRCFFEGYVPDDEAKLWSKLSLTPDPGVLEINLPPCHSVHEYARWMERLEICGTAVGLRSFKQQAPDEILGTGGGNHLLFGGPSLQENAFFTHPEWVTSILRYWQHHPSLSYLFTGSYVGASSQAPRPDECSRELYDLEMAYQFLENLEEGQDNRYLISETLRHLHIDRSGNTHRSEASFDKFWNTAWEGGCRGLIEFRAIETLPHAAWMSSVALLWSALAAFLLEKGFHEALIEHGTKLNDHYFLPSPLWEDFKMVLGDLKNAGLALDEATYRAIWEYRFPEMLKAKHGEATLIVRKALESWPLLCETPLEGGTTSRFVDTSIERLEFTGNRAFLENCRIFVQGRELKLGRYPGAEAGAGLRYRRSALYPSLHPGIAPHSPLTVTIADRHKKPLASCRLQPNQRLFEPCSHDDVPTLDGARCKKLRPELLTCDLRLT